MFRQEAPLDLDRLAPVAPAALAQSLGKPELAAYALQLLAVMALVDGVLDGEKIAAVAGYAQALGIEEAYLAELTEAAAGHLRWALMDMTRKNIESIIDKPWAEDGDAMGFFLPYRNGATDPALAARYEELGKRPREASGAPSGISTSRTAISSPARKTRSTRSSPRRMIRPMSSAAMTRRRRARCWSPPSPPPCIANGRWPAISCP